MLRQGYGVAANTLNVYGNNCEDLLAAESFAMTRERFLENFGLADLTIGYGCSGGSEAQHPISGEYPGLLDAVIVGCSFPEVTAAMVNNITDADLMLNYLQHNTEVTWSNAQILAISGYPTVTTLNTIGPRNAVRVKAQGGSCNAATAIEGARRRPRVSRRSTDAAYARHYRLLRRCAASAPAAAPRAGRRANRRRSRPADDPRRAISHGRL
jgi:hypothetical protein